MGHALVQAARAGGEARRPLLDRDALVRLHKRVIIDDQDLVLRQRWDELPREAKAMLLRDPDRLPPVWSRIKSSDQVLLRNLGLGIPTEGWVPDPPFFDWLLLNRTALQREIYEPK